jgi:hypothetical protein
MTYIHLSQFEVTNNHVRARANGEEIVLNRALDQIEKNRFPFLRQFFLLDSILTQVVVEGGISGKTVLVTCDLDPIFFNLRNISQASFFGNSALTAVVLKVIFVRPSANNTLRKA